MIIAVLKSSRRGIINILSYKFVDVLLRGYFTSVGCQKVILIRPVLINVKQSKHSHDVLGEGKLRAASLRVCESASLRVCDLYDL